MHHDRYPLPSTNREEAHPEQLPPDGAIPLQSDHLTAPDTVAGGFREGRIPDAEQVRSYRVGGPERGPSHKLLKKIIAGVGAGAIALGVGGYFGVKALANDTEPRQEASTSAPAIPGEQLPGTSELSPDTYEFEVAGQTYKGVRELEQGFGIKVDTEAEFPDAERVVTEGVNGLNLWMNYGTTNQRESDDAEGRVSHDSQYVGIGAVLQDVTNPAMEQVFTTDSNSEGAEVEGFRTSINELHLQNAAYGYQTLKAQDAVQYRAEYTITGPINVHIGTNEGISATVPVSWSDNADQNTMGELRTESTDGWDGVTTPTMSRPDLLLHISFEQADGFDGTKYWKIISANLG